jgi:peptidyl-prolyl cis-trans isomerase A (cyclophilin A)
MTAAAPALYEVVFETSRGEFVVEVDREWAPRGADRFFNLVRFGFYDGAAFFRVLPGFIAQFGIPTLPVLSAVWRDQPIQDDPLRQSNVRGTLSFATRGPNTRTHQVFVNLRDNANLDFAGFTPFGRVIRGMEVVDSLYAGYGEGPPGGAGPDQTRIQQEGAAYLQREFPRLDVIQRARVEVR